VRSWRREVRVVLKRWAMAVASFDDFEA
jgi:hypothetical protein